ncbi:RNA polymerase sigma factor [bacterium]|nr:RNA polymerase sigma factor [bacterium]
MKKDYGNERNLVENVLKKDREAVRYFIDSYKRLVEHIIWRMVKRREEREDLFQDVFLKIFSSLETFRFKCKLSSWVGRITYNTCLNRIKKKKAALASDISPEKGDDDIFISRDKTHDILYESEEYIAIIKNEIMGMEPSYRTILTLYHIDELSYREIGEIMDIPAGTVKSYLFRARQKLRLAVEKKYKGELSCQNI